MHRSSRFAQFANRPAAPGSLVTERPLGQTLPRRRGGTFRQACLIGTALSGSLAFTGAANGQAFNGTPVTVKGSIVYNRATPGIETITISTSSGVGGSDQRNRIAWTPNNTGIFLPDGNTATFQRNGGPLTVVNQLNDNGSPISLDGTVIARVTDGATTGISGRVAFENNRGFNVGSTANFSVGDLSFEGTPGGPIFGANGTTTFVNWSGQLTASSTGPFAQQYPFGDPYSQVGNGLRLIGTDFSANAGSLDGDAGTRLALQDSIFRLRSTALNLPSVEMTRSSFIFDGGAANSTRTLTQAFTLNDIETVRTEGARTLTLTGPIGGPGSLSVAGTGTTILAGANTYTGPTTVDGGELRVNGSVTSAVTVQSFGTLSGAGSVNGLVTVQSGGTLAPGQGPGPGTLTVAALNLNAGSTSVFQLGAAGVAGGVSNDLVNVTGNLTLGGTLSVNAPSAGYYRLFNYGTLTPSSFSSVTGSTQGTPTVLTNVANQVNLSIVGAGQQLQFWDGGDLAGNGVVNGGAGVWNAANTNWTGATGQADINDQWRSSVGVFAGAAAGTVSVVGTQAFDTLQFSTTGYVLNSGAAGQLQLAAGGVAATINTDAGITATINASLVDGSSTGLAKVGGGTLALGGVNTYSGGTTVSGGTLTLAAGASLASGVTNNATFVNSGAVNGTVSNTSTFTNDATGTVSGLVTNSGTLTNFSALNGGLVSTAGTAINTGSIGGTTTIGGGLFAGTGNTQNLAVNGGTFAPGNGTAGSSMTVTGSLTLTAAATYLVQVNPATASLTNVTGTATLGGAAVQANFAAGSYVARQYTIVHATGGVNGTFGSVTNSLPSAFSTTLSYDGNNAYLNLTLNFVPPPGGGLTANQQNVANAVVGFFNSTGTIPLVFGGLTPAGLTQISGETATGSQQTTFNAMNQFMGVMTDPFIAGRGDPISAGGNPNAYADQSMPYAAGRNPNDALAAIYSKAPPVAPVFEQRWSVWSAGFGGSQTTDGSAITGSNNVRSSVYGVAAGADYRLSPNTLAGFALAGGGTNFNVNGFGSGRSDLFQAGAFIRHNAGPAYITGALAYGWQDITTDRTVTVAGIDRLRAQFNANAWTGRVEGGYRFVNQGFGWTPYAAGQFTAFDLPAYAEQVISGANTFALAYTARSVTDTRSELGLRSDKSFALQDGIFTLRGRAAWAHNFNTDRAALPTFQALPGASFVVNGAAQAPNAALITGSAEMKWISGWSVAATFEGEFSNVTESYAGKGVVRYAW
jgi:autotransporter-associated beta strand protein